MQEMKEVPVSLLIKLEEDRLAMYKWLKDLGNKVSEMDRIRFGNLTGTMWEVATRKKF